MSADNLRHLHSESACYFLNEREEIVDEFREINKSLIKLDDKLDSLEFQVLKMGQDLFLIKSALTKLLELKDQADPAE